MRTRKPHLLIHNHGSLLLIEPRTRAARAWLEEHTDGTWWAGSLVVEPRYAKSLVHGMQLDGFTVGGAE